MTATASSTGVAPADSDTDGADEPDGPAAAATQEAFEARAEGDPDAPSLGDMVRRSLQRLATAAAGRLVDAAVDKVDDLVDKVDDLPGKLQGLTQNGGIGLGAAFGAFNAKMAGKNPVVGAIKGAWGALSTSTKVWIVLGLVLLGLLSPVALVLVLVGLLVAAIVKAAGS